MVTSAALLHLSGNATELDLSQLCDGSCGGGARGWNVTTLHQPDPVAGLLSNMSTAVRAVAILSGGETLLRVLPYAVVTMARISTSVLAGAQQR